MVGFSYQIDDAQLHAGLRSLIALGRDAGPIMADIAAIGESSTRMRFRTETGPDGQKWKPSLRARITGGRTLTKDGHLSGSISGRHGRDFAEWGVNRIYAAIHQFGGEIRAGQVFGHPLHPAGRLVERGDLPAGGGELHRLAARRGAQIEHAAAFSRCAE